MSEYLTIDEAAAVCRLSARTVRRGLKSSVRPLRHYRVGRRVVIARSDLASWLEMHRAVPEVGVPATGAVAEILNRLNRTPGAPAEAKS